MHLHPEDAFLPFGMRGFKRMHQDPLGCTKILQCIPSTLGSTPIRIPLGINLPSSVACSSPVCELDRAPAKVTSKNRSVVT